LCQGKRLNLIQRGSYERRVFLSGLRYNKSLKWHSSPWKDFTKHSPGQHFKTFISKPPTKTKKASTRRKLFTSTEIKNTKKHNKDYVKEAEIDEDLEDFVKLESQLNIKNLQLSTEERDEIQTRSVGQFHNDFYKLERRTRLTASLFGSVIKRPYTPCHNLVKSCLHTKHFYSEHTRICGN
jgi:hypothetical protein